MISSAQTGGVTPYEWQRLHGWIGRSQNLFSDFFGVIFFLRRELAKQISVSARFTLAQQAWFRLNSDLKTYLIKRGWNEH